MSLPAIEEIEKNSVHQGFVLPPSLDKEVRAAIDPRRISFSEFTRWGLRLALQELKKETN